MASEVTNVTVCIAGDAGVGKTSILSRLANGCLSSNTKPTVGLDFESALVRVGEELVRVKIYDLSGEERFLPHALRHIRTADALVFVYDVTRRSSLAGAQGWHAALMRHARAPNIPLLLLGNHSDRRHQRDVSMEEAKRFAIPEGMKYIECSALTGSNVTSAFQIIAADVISYRSLGTRQVFGQVPTPSSAICHDQMLPEVTYIPHSACDDVTPTHVYRVLMLGASRAGKTALRLRYCRDYFSPHYFASGGLEYCAKSMRVDSQRVKLQLWDISGSERFAATRRSYFRSADAYVIVYDVTDRSTFAHAQEVYEDLVTHGQYGCPVLLLANKCDRWAPREVGEREGSECARGWGASFAEVSAKTGTNVATSMLKIIVALNDKFNKWQNIYQ